MNFTRNMIFSFLLFCTVLATAENWVDCGFSEGDGFPSVTGASTVVDSFGNSWTSHDGIVVGASLNFGDGTDALHIKSDSTVVISPVLEARGLGTISFDYYKPERDDWVNIHLYYRKDGGLWKRFALIPITSRTTPHSPEFFSSSPNVAGNLDLKIEVEYMDGIPREGVLIDNLVVSDAIVIGEPFSYSCGFESSEGFSTTAFSSIQSGEMFFEAVDSSQVEITTVHANSGANNLHVLGGTDKEFIVTLSPVESVAEVSFWAERWTRGGIFAFYIDASADGSNWDNIFTDDVDDSDDSVVQSEVVLAPGSSFSIPVDFTKNYKKLRFRLSSSGGVLIDDLNVSGFLPAADMSLESTSVSLVSSEISRFASSADMLKFEVDCLGSLSPLKVEELIVETVVGDTQVEKIIFQTETDALKNQVVLAESTLDSLGTVNYNCDYELESGKNIFYINAALIDSLEIDSVIQLNPVSIKISGTTYPLSLSETTVTVADIPHRQVLAAPGDYGSKNYRIPGLATSNLGTLLAVFDIRYDSENDLPDNIDVGLRRSTDNGKSWSKLKVIMDMNDDYEDVVENTYGNGIGDPAILVDRSNNVIYVSALWTCGPENAFRGTNGQGLEPYETGQFILVKSEDDGVTWSEPINITKQVKDPSWHMILDGPGKGICLKDGTLVFAAQFINSSRKVSSSIVYSKDHGETWKVGTAAKLNTTESQVIELDDGSIMMTMRTNGSDYRSVATTMDLGATWVEHPTTNTIIDPVCQGSIDRFDKHSILLFTNPHSKNSRTNLCVQTSVDDGMSWPYIKSLEPGAAWYSCLTILPDNSIGCFYENVTMHTSPVMVFERFSLEWATDGALTTPLINDDVIEVTDIIPATISNGVAVINPEMILATFNGSPITDFENYEVVVMYNRNFSSVGGVITINDTVYDFVTSVRVKLRNKITKLVSNSFVEFEIQLSDSLLERNWVVSEFDEAMGFPTPSNNQINELLDSAGNVWQSDDGFFISSKPDFNGGSSALQLKSDSSVIVSPNSSDKGLGGISFDYYKPERDDWVNLHLYYRKDGGEWVRFERIVITSRSTPHSPEFFEIKGMVIDGDVELKLETEYMDGVPQQGVMIDNLLIKNVVVPVVGDEYTQICGFEDDDGFGIAPLISTYCGYDLWSANEGEASINGAEAQLGAQALLIEGGTDNEVVVNISSLEQISQLTFWAERWTSKGIFAFYVEGSADGITWDNLYSDDGDNSDDGNVSSVTPLGAPAKAVVAIDPSKNYTQFKFKLSSRSGVLIDDVSLTGVYKLPDELANPVAMTVGNIGVSVVDSEISRFTPSTDLLKFEIETAGLLSPLRVEELVVEVLDTVGNSEIQKITLQTEEDSLWNQTVLAESLINSPQNVSLSCDYELKSGKNIFSLNVDFSESLTVGAEVRLNPVSIKISGTIYPFTEQLATTVVTDIPHRTILVAPGDYGSKNYRIPGLATTNSGSLLAVFDIRYDHNGDLAAHIDVGLKRSTDNGRSWEKMKVIMDMNDDYEDVVDNTYGNGIGDPAILVDKVTGTIYVSALWTCGPENAFRGTDGQGLEPYETGQFILVKSEDDGVTWSEPINITKQVKQPEWHMVFDGPGKGITLHDGTLVFPAQFLNENRQVSSTVVCSKDRGETWTIGAPAKWNTTEAQVVELDDGTIMMTMRTNGSDYRSVATTTDLGQTWIEHPTTNTVIDPVCQASIDRFENHGILLFTNPHSMSSRSNMSVQVSVDNGMNWDYVKTLEVGGSAYSCLSILQDNSIGCFYEVGTSIVFDRFSLDWATDGVLGTPSLDDSLNIVSTVNQLVLSESGTVTIEPEQFSATLNDIVIDDYENYDVVIMHHDSYSRNGSEVTFNNFTTGDSLDVFVRLRHKESRLLSDVFTFTLSVEYGDFELINQDGVLSWNGNEDNVSYYLVERMVDDQWELIERLEVGTVSSYEIDTDYDFRLVVAYVNGVRERFGTFDFSLSPGWNLISMPLENVNFGLFSETVSASCWGWSGAAYYLIDETPLALDGVWVYSNASTRSTVGIAGEIVDSKAITLEPGWNLYGPVRDSVIPVDLQLTIFSWDGEKYTLLDSSDILKRGKSYWFFTFEEVYIEL